MKETEPKEEMLQSAYDMLYLTVCGIHEKKAEEKRLEAMNLPGVFAMAKKHSLQAITYMAVEGMLADATLSKKWREEKDKAIRKNILLDAERMQLLAYCEEAGIWYMPLKGSILKEMYPNPGMRQMADNDILFDKKYRKEIKEWFVTRGYKVKMYGRDIHDIYLKPPVMNFEMHASIVSKEIGEKLYSYYRNVKERLVLENGTKYGYCFTDEDFYLYLLAHEYKHFKKGGTGLRSLLDGYVYLNCHPSLDLDYVRKEAKGIGLAEFEKETRELCLLVFKEPDAFSLQELNQEQKEMLEWYLSSGTYGNMSNVVHSNIKEAMQGSDMDIKQAKRKVFFRRLFPDKAFMRRWCELFLPAAKDYPFLYPLVSIYRIFYKLFTNRGSIKEEYAELKKIKEEKK